MDVLRKTPAQPELQTAATPSAEAPRPDARVQRSRLRASTYEEGAAMLAPPSEAVQMKVEGEVAGLDKLATPAAEGDTEMEAGNAAQQARNAPKPEEPLPYGKGGWDHRTLLGNLGQVDRIRGTDSDHSRCVQAVALASHILRGPDATAAYLTTVLGTLPEAKRSPRAKVACEVIRNVAAKIAAHGGTYGDLSWAQEALHDAFYADDTGTPDTDLKKQLAPDGDQSQIVTTTSQWCEAPADLLAQAAGLAPGEQLLVVSWNVVINDVLAEARLQHEEQTGTDPGELEQAEALVDGKHRVRCNRLHLEPGKRPTHAQLNIPRDRRWGHQLLVARDDAGKLMLYDPEMTKSGKHTKGLAGGRDLAAEFHDQPEFSTYMYAEIIGRIRPATRAPGR